MVNKRLINMLSKSKVYIALTVVSMWISLIANIVAMFFIANVLEKALLKTLVSNDVMLALVVIVLAIIIRSIFTIIADNLAFKASIGVKKTLRSKYMKSCLN